MARNKATIGLSEIPFQKERKRKRTRKKDMHDLTRGYCQSILPATPSLGIHGPKTHQGMLSRVPLCPEQLHGNPSEKDQDRKRKTLQSQITTPCPDDPGPFFVPSLPLVQVVIPLPFPLLLKTDPASTSLGSAANALAWRNPPTQSPRRDSASATRGGHNAPRPCCSHRPGYPG